VKPALGPAAGAYAQIEILPSPSLAMAQCKYGGRSQRESSVFQRPEPCNASANLHRACRLSIISFLQTVATGPEMSFSRTATKDSILSYSHHAILEVQI
jgi:hypothetical protein